MIGFVPAEHAAGTDSAEGARVRLQADPADAETLRGLVGQYRELLTAHDPATASIADPALARLFPDPVPGDASASAEARRLTGPALRNHKLAAADRITAALQEPGPLTPADELAWLQWLTDIRLVLAARLGIVVDGDNGIAEDGPHRAMQWTYLLLGSLQGELVELIDDLDARDTAAEHTVEDEP